MRRKVSREDEDVALLKLVGAVLDNTTGKPKRRFGRLPAWLRSPGALRLRVKLRRLIRRNPLVPASVVLCALVWICVANVMRSAPAKATRSVRARGGEPLRVVHLQTPPMVHDESQGITEDDNRSIRPLSYWFEQLEDPDWKVRSDAAFELVKKSRSSTMILSALPVLLDDPHAGVRFWVVDRFRVLGIYRANVRSAMREFLGNEELLALYKETSTRMRQAFLMIVRCWMADLDDDVRWTGLVVCGMLGSGASTFEQQLETIAKNDIHELYRRQARVMLRNLPGVRQRSRGARR